MTNIFQKTFIVPEKFNGVRIDIALSQLLNSHSRTEIKQWIEKNFILCNGKLVRPKDKLIEKQKITINAILKPKICWHPQKITLEIIAEDDALIIINKPAGMVVHPAPGHPNNTLINALLSHEPNLCNIPRSGIIHRLDKDTSGLLIVAKTSEAAKYLSTELKKRNISRKYIAIVCGSPISGSTVNLPIGRNNLNRKKMAVTTDGKCAITHYRISEKFREHASLDVQLETGRTHQIRVHMSHIGYPLIGDPKYSKRLNIPKKATPQLIQCLQGFKRQALHAANISFHHPKTKKQVTYSAPLPKDMQNLLEILRKDNLKKVM